MTHLHFTKHSSNLSGRDTFDGQCNINDCIVFTWNYTWISSEWYNETVVAMHRNVAFDRRSLATFLCSGLKIRVPLIQVLSQKRYMSAKLDFFLFFYLFYNALFLCYWYKQSNVCITHCTDHPYKLAHLTPKRKKRKN